ncbi:nucleotidyltransferase family protein [Acidithiobacillus sulfuriphilus]|uniref:Nucleotidyltransferase family protein n=2 Tax=Acidithiobacillus sulfuriphilus TaxID=1867749 RepID=A0A3M8QYS4_9PROT|nr:nucleotidyltransferase family protein [Acidithiobacillus sulfuriphilus]RNF61468.1 nucleotidyltransferase family protein [Acidithiobacillus sulfuriphilus]
MPSRGVIAGVLLAAGASRRFGSPKLLQPLAGGTPMALASAHALMGGTDRLIAVIRPEDEALARLFADHDVPVLPCPESSQGMGRSIVCGVRASAEADAWIIALADMPFIQKGTIQGVAELLRDGAVLAAPLYAGRQGHPVGFSRSLGSSLCKLEGDEGARGIVAQHLDGLRLYPCSDSGVHRDIDTPEDLASCESLGMR